MNHPAPSAPFRAQISRRLSLLLGLIFIVVLFIGGIVLLSAQSIYLSTEKVERQGRHVEAIDGLHSAVYHLVSALQATVITGIPLPAEEQQRLTTDLKVRLQQYTELEVAEESFPDKDREMGIFLEIGKAIGELLPMTDKAFAAVARGQRLSHPDMENLMAINTRIPDLAHAMNEIHRINMKQAIAESRARMWLILGFYLGFILIGSLLILGSNLVFHRNIVLPIRRLAAATLELAQGDFRKRVPVTSQDEIGQLAHSFNEMAERLEEHERMLQNLATLKERERIAREMHDGLAQALGYLHLRLATLEARSAAEAPNGIRGELQNLKTVVGKTYEEVQQSIFGLRTMLSRGLGLIPTLTEYLHDFSQQNGIAVDLQIGDERAARFSPEAEVQLVRIIQEALANVRKHAGATQAVVRFDLREGRRCVSVSDDGHGFEPEHVMEKASRHFGLQTMRERAEGIGGGLEIESASGQGTTVTVRLPL